jgi:hypothetical protein
MPDNTARKPPGKMTLLLRAAIGIFLLDRWIFQPLNNLAKRPGPLLTLGSKKQPGKKRKGKKPMNKKVIDGFTVTMLLVVGVVAILAVGLWYRFAPNVAAKLEGSDATPAA